MSQEAFAIYIMCKNNRQCPQFCTRNYYDLLEKRGIFGALKEAKEQEACLSKKLLERIKRK